MHPPHLLSPESVRSDTGAGRNDRDWHSTSSPESGWNSPEVQALRVRYGVLSWQRSWTPIPENWRVRQFCISKQIHYLPGSCRRIPVPREKWTPIRVTWLTDINIYSSREFSGIRTWSNWQGRTSLPALSMNPRFPLWSSTAAVPLKKELARANIGGTTSWHFVFT